MAAKSLIGYGTLIEDSVEKFIGFKLALTSIALILLVIHHNVQLTKEYV